MDGMVPEQNEFWEESVGVAAREISVRTSHGGAGIFRGPHQASEFAQKLYAFEALNPPAQRLQPEPPAEPYSLQWFLDIEKQRHSRQGKWIPKLLEFAKHNGETLLGLGHGLGTDWVQYAREGARVVVCSASQPQLELVRRNFGLRGLAGRFISSKPTKLPLENASIDVACLSSLHVGIDDAPAVVNEVFRVLKPGGKVLAVTPARYDVDFWFNTLFFWHSWVDGRKRLCEPKRPRYTGRELKKLFQQFDDHSIYKRQLRHQEVPRVWRWMPTPFLSRFMGRILLLKAFKPLRTALNEK